MSFGGDSGLCFCVCSCDVFSTLIHFLVSTLVAEAEEKKKKKSVIIMITMIAFI